ncbi:MAG: hypothetical protein AAF632_20640 [Bacteroidota bacterium]
MKKLLNLTVIAILLCVHSAFAKVGDSSSELEDLFSQLVDRVNNKSFDGNLLVFDFTDQSDTPTALGAYFAEELSNYLVNAPGKFIVIERTSVSSEGWFTKLSKAVAKEADNYLGDEDAQRTQSAAQTSKVFFSNTKDKRLKNVDAIVYGSYTNMGDYYRLSIKVKRKKDDGLLATVNGDVSNQPIFAQLDQTQKKTNSSTSNTATATASTDNSTIYSDPGTRARSEDHVFRKNQLVFELIKCVESGRYVECHLRITSEGKDTELGLYGSNYTKIFNQADGAEHVPTSVNIANKTHQYSVSKEIIRDTPVTSVITFEPKEDIEVISRLTAYFTTPETRNFTLDLYNIFVE